MNTERQAERESEINVNHFDADELFVRIEHEGTTALRIDNEPGDFIRRFMASILRSSADGELDETAEKVATIEFQVLATSAWGERPSLMEVFDAESADHLAIFEALYDEDGVLRDELNVIDNGDLIYVELIEVGPCEDAFEVVRHALENIFAQYGRACFGAVYCQANWESIGIARTLKDRGFVPTRERKIWFLNLGNERAPLR
ncbi:MAG: hypothetical protein INH41_27220 [Myxococcaceae bacterium]|nr:hypothetical protein [Myxococcaceae bacterium]